MLRYTGVEFGIVGLSVKRAKGGRGVGDQNLSAVDLGPSLGQLFFMFNNVSQLGALDTYPYPLCYVWSTIYLSPFRFSV